MRTPCWPKKGFRGGRNGSQGDQRRQRHPGVCRDGVVWIDYTPLGGPLAAILRQTAPALTVGATHSCETPLWRVPADGEK
jgi:hypothetical protein